MRDDSCFGNREEMIARYKALKTENARLRYSVKALHAVAKLARSTTRPSGYPDVRRSLTDIEEIARAAMGALVEAAQTTLDEWDAPIWKRIPPNTDIFAALRAALAQVQESAK